MRPYLLSFTAALALTAAAAYSTARAEADPAAVIATYGDIAQAAGRPRAWRAVGNILRECGERTIPCHRVIAAGGKLGGYGSSPHLKAALLRAEGVGVVGGRVKDWRERRAAPSARTRRAAAPASGNRIPTRRRAHR